MYSFKITLFLFNGKPKCGRSVPPMVHVMSKGLFVCCTHNGEVKVQLLQSFTKKEMRVVVFKSVPVQPIPSLFYPWEQLDNVMLATNHRHRHCGQHTSFSWEEAWLTIASQRHSSSRFHSRNSTAEVAAEDPSSKVAVGRTVMMRGLPQLLKRVQSPLEWGGDGSLAADTGDSTTNLANLRLPTQKSSPWQKYIEDTDRSDDMTWVGDRNTK